MRLSGDWRCTHHVLYGVGIERDHTDGCCPFVVLLVNFLIEGRVVKEPGGENMLIPFFSSLARPRQTEGWH